ncbi:MULTISPECIES: hypothetical protein [unclassified Streptomyces]|uniref:hypothetical protein n=1 Tax=unclassified Streptomyces TaxID=2593676 RepID=UPI0036E36025
MAKLVETFGARWKLSPRLHPEYPLLEAYVAETSRRITGLLELKAQGHDVTPDGSTEAGPGPVGADARTAVARYQSGSCGHNSGAQVRPDEGSCGGAAVGFSSVASAASKAGMSASPCSASSKLSNLVFGAGDAS